MNPERTKLPGPRATSPDVLEATEKAREALELRKTGMGYRQIAKTLGCGLSRAHGYVRAALDELRSQVLENATQLRDLEIQTLDSLQCALFETLNRPETDRAKVANAIVRVSESRRKLLGLDSPQRVEMTGNLYTVKEASPDCEAWGKPAQP